MNVDFERKSHYYISFDIENWNVVFAFTVFRAQYEFSLLVGIYSFLVKYGEFGVSQKVSSLLDKVGRSEIFILISN